MKRKFVSLLAFFCLATTLLAQPNNYKSKVEKYTFSNELSKQEKELKTNPMLKYYAEKRKESSKDPHLPIFHFSSPEIKLNDPNGLSYWNGQWHLFYQAYPLKDPRQHWGHAVSDDLTHWRDLPLAIYPDPEEKCFSGSVYVEDDRAIAMYHGTKQGSMIAVSDDPLLLNWEKINDRKPVLPTNPSPEKAKRIYGDKPRPGVFDPFLWKKGDYYYALNGRKSPNKYSGHNMPVHPLYRSKDLENWEYMHPFMENNIFSLPGDDGACPYFWPIGNGDKHILLHFSHQSGGQYFLGDYDTERDKYIATSHGKFNHGAVKPSGVHAPSAYPDGKGGVIAIFNTNGKQRIMTLPIRLTLPDNNKDLHMEPAIDCESLRYAEKSLGAFELEANKEIKLEGISGNAMEIITEIDVKKANVVELNLLMSPDKEEYTKISFYKNRGYRDMKNPPEPSVIVLDNSNSSILPPVSARPPETAQVFIGDDETVKLRIFIDKSVVEVFVNDRQYLCSHVYPGLESSLGASIKAIGSEAEVKSFKAWQMKSIWE